MNEEFLDLDTIATRLGCHKITLLMAIRNEELNAITGVWKGYRTTNEWVNAWLDSKQTIKTEKAKAGGK